MYVLYKSWVIITVLMTTAGHTISGHFCHMSTGIHYVPVSSWTMEKGSQRVEMFGVEDKWHITAVFAGSFQVVIFFIPSSFAKEKPVSACHH